MHAAVGSNDEVGVNNFLVEGVSGTGKTSVCDELARRGFQTVHGDRELAYSGDPLTGEPRSGGSHEHHLWDVGRVRALVADDEAPMTFFCGGSRNFRTFIDLFDEVFVLQVDRETLLRRLAKRPPGEWGSSPAELELVLRLHESGEDVPSTGVRIDAARDLATVVDDIVAIATAGRSGTGGSAD